MKKTIAFLLALLMLLTLAGAALPLPFRWTRRIRWSVW